MEENLFLGAGICGKHRTVNASCLEIDKQGHESRDIRFMPVDKELFVSDRSRTVCKVFTRLSFQRTGNPFEAYTSVIV